MVYGIEAYIFLFFLAFIWSLFAGIYDLKTTEVPNWLSYSLILFAFIYRLFYSYQINDFNFFLYGLYGFGLFYLLGYLFYYGNVFAGGDAKLLMGFGVILPFEKLFDYFSLSIGFIFVLFGIGAIYSLIYSIGIAFNRRKVFVKEFNGLFKRSKMIILPIFVLVFFLILFIPNLFIWMKIVFFLIFSVFLFLFIYLKAIDKCMYVVYPPEKLRE